MKRDPSTEEIENWRTAGVAAGLGCSIVASVLLGIVGGVLLDRWLDTEPVFTLIGVALAIALAGYQLWELAESGKKDATPGPVTRQVAKVTGKRKKSDS